jgi:hypothetical protein
MGTGPTSVANDTSTTRPPPSLFPGSLELVSPVSIGTTRRLRLPRVSAPSLCRSMRDTSNPQRFSHRPTAEPRTGIGTLFHRSGRCRLWPRGPAALPSYREKLCHSALSAPGRTSAPNLKGASVLPTFFLQRRLHRYNLSRGSITRFGSWLPTLEGAISDARQDSLPVRCRRLVRLGRAGWFPPGFS